MTQQPPAYRVFISYTHQDEELVSTLESILQANGLTPMRDKHFAYGVGFHDQIKRFIQYAHVFMPVITKQSSERGWVHQEIGFAIAQNVPVLPVAIDWEPREWLQPLHAVMLREKQISADSDTLRAIFSVALFRELVNRFRDERFAVYSCGFLQEDRTKMIAEYADEVASIQALWPQQATGDDALSSKVRQKGALSSFHIPDDPPSAQIWRTRSGKYFKSVHYCRLQREERLALTRHASRWGCRLIIDPTIPFTDQGSGVRKVRLECLLKYLKSSDGSLTEVAITREKSEMSRTENITIVGNWFLALAVAAASGHGYYQTIFTRHAPILQARIAEFDEEFFRILDKEDLKLKDSRQRAIDQIQGMVNSLKGIEAQAGGEPCETEAGK